MATNWPPTKKVRYDPELEGIIVSATSVTTKLLQMAKKAPAAATEGTGA